MSIVIYVCVLSEARYIVTKSTNNPYSRNFKGRYTLGDTSQRQIASWVLENFEKVFVAATEFCRRNKVVQI